jgi:hypothetical protein
MVIDSMKLIWVMALAAMVFTSCTASAEYFTHSFDTFDFSISPPEGVNIKGVEWGLSSGSMVDVYLTNDESFFVWNSKVFDWEEREASDQNLEAIWASDADSGEHSTPKITHLGNGEYVVTGRMIRSSTMITRANKIYDFDRDGLVDWQTTWNINGKYDLDIIEKLAASSEVVKIQPIWD